MASKQALMRALSSVERSIDADQGRNLFGCMLEIAIELYFDQEEGVYNAYTGIYPGEGGHTVRVRSWQEYAEEAQVREDLRGQVDACMRAYLPSFFN
jgi:hypothetical protein